MIFFREEDHTYRLDDPVTGELCISATTFIGLFKAVYDSDFWSWYTALRYAKNMEKKKFSSWLIWKYKFSFEDLRSMTTEEKKDQITKVAEDQGVPMEIMLEFQQQALAEWKAKNLKSQKKGTSFHNYKEGEVYEQEGIEYEGVFADVQKSVRDLSNLATPNNVVIAPELQMYNRNYKLSGTADKVFIYPNRQFDIDDWKTNEEIKIKNDYDKMLYPIAHLDDCNYNHYKLQVSLYAWMLEQWGYKPRILKFTHVNIDKNNNILNQVEYRTRYMKREIENMLEYYQQNKEILLQNLK